VVTLWLPLFLLLQFASTTEGRGSHRALPHIEANDNRRPAGVLRDGVLQLHLVAQDGLFFPDGEKAQSFQLQAFGEEGKSPTASAPLIRVPVGTDVHVSIRNTLAVPLMVRGLYDRRSAVPDSSNIAPGAEAQLRFRASVPGTYFYFGRTTSKPVIIGDGEDGQLVGAFVVDPPSRKRPTMADRILVITSWFKPDEARALNVKPNEIITVNGHSWPFTERLSYTVGDSIQWRVINSTAIWHPLHLHGFYFRVDSRGDNWADTIFTERQQRTAVTEWVRAASTMTMAWSPARAGNWLFHCHLLAHVGPELRLSASDAPVAGHEMNHATDGMAGLVMGIVVKPRPGQRVVRENARPPEKVLRLFVNSRANVFGSDRGYSFVLQEGPNAPAADSIRIPGSTLHLVRGERTQITIVNHSPEPVSVHWHGIELESYYDGVSGWSGSDARVAPMIAPNDSFVVRVTPVRAGTFIYHTHADEAGQLGAGLYGPVLIAEPNAPVDTATDHTFVLGLGGPNRAAAPWVNGSADPAPTTLVLGRTYRLRFINISPNGREDIVLRADSLVQQWRALAKDGANLPEWQATTRPAHVHMGAGETTDFEFTPLRVGDLVLESTVRSLGLPVKIVKQHLLVQQTSP
jgi:FtsP/CotA-like multicopper oxidase with cupredoxin domain